MARHNSFKRPSPSRVAGVKIIIVCEGKKTERGYFEEIRKSMKLPTVRIYVEHPNATDPRSIVRAAIYHRQERKNEGTWDKRDSAWAVFDGDEHRLTNFDNWNAALQSADSNKIKLAISNPSFEFWYLLHYQNQTAQLTRQQALASLRRHISDYDKADALWPLPLKPLTAEAIRRAKQLAERATADGLQPHTNPCTGVCELVEKLLELAEQTHR